MQSEGRVPKRVHSDRGILEVDDGRFIKKVPQTSVAPTYKLTLPSEFVVANLSHLIDQSFDLTDTEGKEVWRVALLPRKNKSKYEYTLQGWKAFALSHNVQTGDRLQIALLPDSRRMCAEIVKRASLTERLPSDTGPASPTLPDMASAAKRQYPASGELSLSSSDAEQCHRDGSPRSQRPPSGTTSYSCEPAVGEGTPAVNAPGGVQHGGVQQQQQQRDAARAVAAHAAAAGHHVKLEGLQALSSTLVQQLYGSFGASAERLPLPGAQQRAEEAGRRPNGAGASLLLSGAYSAFAEANRREEQQQLQEEAENGSNRRGRRAGIVRRLSDCSGQDQDTLEPYTPRKLKSLSTVLQNHPKRQRTGLVSGAATMSAERQWSGADLACANGMALLSSAAELDAEQAEGSLADEAQPPPQDDHSRRLSSSSDHAQGLRPADGGEVARRLAAMEEALEVQTSRGLIVVSALLKIAARLVAPVLLAGADEGAAAELAALHAELKEHTNCLLDAMWHMRNLPRVCSESSNARKEH